MSVSSIALMTFAATALLVLSLGMWAYDRLFRYRILLNERVKELTSQESPEKSIHLFKDWNALRGYDPSEMTLASRFKQLIEEAGASWTMRQLGAASAVSALIACAMVAWCAPWAFAVGAPVGAVLPPLALIARRRLRRRKLCRQLPEAFEMISRAVRAGQTVPSALKIIADDFEAPIANEFALCYEQQNLGLSREAALRKLARRTGVMELQIFVVALLVQAKAGGNLVELLDNLALTIRKRLKLSERVRALTGEGRMQARILLALPIAALLCLMASSPDYAAVAFEWPWLLAATAVAQVVGALWIRKIVNFEY